MRVRTTSYKIPITMSTSNTVARKPLDAISLTLMCFCLWGSLQTVQQNTHKAVLLKPGRAIQQVGSPPPAAGTWMTRTAWVDCEWLSSSKLPVSIPFPESWSSRCTVLTHSPSNRPLKAVFEHNPSHFPRSHVYNLPPPTKTSPLVSSSPKYSSSWKQLSLLFCSST